MRAATKIGRVAGIPLTVHWSVAVVFGLLVWSLAGRCTPGGTSWPSPAT